MIRDRPKSIVRPQAAAESKDIEPARISTSSTSGKKKMPRPLPPSDAEAIHEWEDEAWKPHRATCYWKADLADFGVNEPLLNDPAPTPENTKK